MSNNLITAREKRVIACYLSCNHLSQTDKKDKMTNKDDFSD
jgi:hypothetical protein